MNILQIGMSSFADEAGGLNRMFDGLSRSLRSSGHDVTTLSCSDRQDGTIDRVIAPHSAPLRVRLAAARRVISRAVGELGPDVVASHFALYAFPALASLANRPFVVHFHGPWALEAQAEDARSAAVRVKAWIEGRVYRRADRLIVLSEAFRTILETRYGVRPEIVHKIPGAVDLDRFDSPYSPAEARARLGWATGEPIFVCVRRLRRRMGLDRLIDASKQLVEAGSRFHVYLVGGGPEEEALRSRIGEAGLGDIVHLVGRVSDDELPLVYRAADWTLVPSIALEGFGLICVESLAAGTPPIVTPIGGLPEIVTPLDPALVSRDATAGALAEAMEAAITGRLMPPDAGRCKAYARQHFGWDTVARLTLDVYRLAVEDHARPIGNRRS